MLKQAVVAGASLLEKGWMLSLHKPQSLLFYAFGVLYLKDSVNLERDELSKVA